MINQKGFTYIQAMIATLMMGLGGVWFAKVGETRSNMNRIDRLSQNAMVVSDVAANALSHEPVCTRALGGKNPGSLPIAFDIKKEDGTGLYAAGQEIDGKIKLKSLELISSDAIDTDLFVGEIEITLEYDKAVRTKKIGVAFATNGGVIEKCAAGDNAVLSVKRYEDNSVTPIVRNFYDYEGRDYWKCSYINLQAAGCTGELGCKVTAYLQYKRNRDQPRMYSARIITESAKYSNNTTDGIYGWTQKYGGGHDAWQLGNGRRHELFGPWDLIKIKNYVPYYCTFGASNVKEGSNSPAYTGTEVYKAVVAVHPAVKAKLVIEPVTLNVP